MELSFVIRVWKLIQPALISLCRESKEHHIRLSLKSKSTWIKSPSPLRIKTPSAEGKQINNDISKCIFYLFFFVTVVGINLQSGVDTFHSFSHFFWCKMTWYFIILYSSFIHSFILYFLFTRDYDMIYKYKHSTHKNIQKHTQTCRL